MKPLLLAVVLLAGCVQHRPVSSLVTLPNGCSGTSIHDPSAQASFDRYWGPELRQSVSYKQAAASWDAGNCDAIFDLVHAPGYRQSPAYAEHLNRVNATSAQFRRDLELIELERDINYWRSRAYDDYVLGYRHHWH